MLQSLAEKFRGMVPALLLSAVVLAVTFAAPAGAFAAEAGSPLTKAAYSGDIEEVGRLLSGGADVNHRDDGGATALIMASQEGHLAVVEALLAKGAELDVQDNNGVTALVMASQNGRGAIVEALLAKGAEIDVRRKNGATALFMASATGHGAMASWATRPAGRFRWRSTSRSRASKSTAG